MLADVKGRDIRGRRMTVALAERRPRCLERKWKRKGEGEARLL
jgi:hypothetical protein